MVVPSKTLAAIFHHRANPYSRLLVMVPLVTKLQVATTRSPTVDAISMLVMMPEKLTESVPVEVPVVNNSKVASAVSEAVITSSMNAAWPVASGS